MPFISRFGGKIYSMQSSDVVKSEYKYLIINDYNIFFGMICTISEILYLCSPI